MTESVAIHGGRAARLFLEEPVERRQAAEADGGGNVDDFAVRRGKQAFRFAQAEPVHVGLGRQAVGLLEDVRRPSFGNAHSADFVVP